MRFPNVYACLDALRRSSPENQSETQKAMNMIWGERPGIEAKYDALLFKLDRSYSALVDKRTFWIRVAEETKLAGTRSRAKSKISSLNMILGELQWMRARNADLINASKIRPTLGSAGTSEPVVDKTPYANLSTEKCELEAARIIFEHAPEIPKSREPLT